MKRTERNTYLWQLLATLLLLVTPGMFSACSNDDTNTTPATTPDSEIRFDVGVWNMLEGTRATFYDDAQLKSEGFMCTAYNGGTTTPYISLVKVNYADSKWSFSDGKHYWPASGSLDFFAYAPYTGASYIKELNCTSPNVTFNCVNLPMTNAGQEDNALEEFVYDIEPGLSKENSASGVSLSFKHPFAKIKLQLSASHPDIQINKITFKSIKNNGSYDHNGSPKWTLDGVATDLVLTFTGDAANFNGNATEAPLTQIGPTFLMIPQEWAGAIEVNATWTDWGDQLAHNVTASVPTTWAPGYSYTYTFTITETDLIVDTSKFTEQW